MTRCTLSLPGVQAALWEAWDPIGVNQFPQARDEYESYAPQILALLQNGATLRELTLHLLRLEKMSMGLPGNPGRCERVARLLIQLRDVTQSDG